MRFPLSPCLSGLSPCAAGFVFKPSGPTASHHQHGRRLGPDRLRYCLAPWPPCLCRGPFISHAREQPACSRPALPPVPHPVSVCAHVCVLGSECGHRSSTMAGTL